MMDARPVLPSSLPAMPLTGNFQPGAPRPVPVPQPQPGAPLTGNFQPGTLRPAPVPQPGTVMAPGQYPSLQHYFQALADAQNHANELMAAQQAQQAQPAPQPIARPMPWPGRGDIARPAPVPAPVPRPTPVVGAPLTGNFQPAGLQGLQGPLMIAPR